MIDTVELMITLILSALLYILLFGEPGYIIPTCELYNNSKIEEEVEYDDNEESENEELN